MYTAGMIFTTQHCHKLIAVKEGSLMLKLKYTPVIGIDIGMTKYLDKI